MTNEADTNASGQRPIAKFTGTGGLSVAVWKNKTEDDHVRYSVKTERVYKDDDGFHNTQMYRDSDLLRLQKLLSLADDWIEQDKGKLTGRSAGVQR